MLIYGRNTVLEALASNYDCLQLYIQSEIKVDDKIQNIINLAKKRDVAIKSISFKELKKITKSEENQGVALEVKFNEHKLREVLQNTESNSFIYISDATYEHNVGAIIRTAECAGLSGVIIPNDLKITPTTIKISTGAIFHIPIIQNSVFNTIKELKDKGYTIIGIERGGKKLFSTKIPQKSLLIIGSEDKGLSEPIKDKCDFILEIPQFGHVNSLNMSVASAIVIYKYLEDNID